MLNTHKVQPFSICKTLNSVETFNKNTNQLETQKCKVKIHKTLLKIKFQKPRKHKNTIMIKQTKRAKPNQEAWTH